MEAWTGEMETLLDLAEELHEKSERAASRIARFRLMELLLGTLSIAAFAGFLDPILGSDRIFLTVRITAAITFCYIGLVEVVMTRRLVGRRRRDLRALYEIVDILREVERAMADRGRWSHLQRAKFRIRLSRFDIGPDSIDGAGWSRVVKRIVEG